MKGFSVLCLLIGVALASVDLDKLDDYNYVQFLSDFGKTSSPQSKIRFEAELTRVKQHNSEDHTWKESINKYSDWSRAEKKMLLGTRSDILAMEMQHNRDNNLFWTPEAPVDTAAVDIDWRTKVGVLSSIKDQGRCGSCWTFGPTEAIESYYFLKHGKRAVLSEQFILDCARNPDQCGGTGGCGGATPKIAIETIVRLQGQPSEWTYPYLSYFGKDFGCHASPSDTPAEVVVSGMDALMPNKAEGILAKLQHGPVFVAVDASAWFPYHSGVFNGCNQTSPVIDHSVLLVGATADSWIIRNSWSPEWGDKGYISLKRYAAGSAPCAEDTSPGAGLGCKGGPKRVLVCGTCGVLYSAGTPHVQ